MPNNYGGFEQFAEFLSLSLVKRGHQVSVYNSHNHPFQGQEWRGVQIIHCYDPEYKFGTIGQFIYDFNCILDTRKRGFDIILQLGYTSSSIWGKLLPRKKSIVTTNMDGLEWKRSKFPKPIQRFLKYAERLAILNSDYLISDSVGIQDYIKNKYHKESVYIPYGANVFKKPERKVLDTYGLKRYQYNILIARLEPENSIEIILDGMVSSKIPTTFLVIGNHQTKYGNFLKTKYIQYSKIVFLGGIYDIKILNNLRYYSNLYFHGHSVGGTNPSLLEAMGSGALICAHDNIFNKAILNDDAFYFKSQRDILKIALEVNKKSHINLIKNNLYKIKNTYSWQLVNDQYLNHFETIIKNSD